MLQTCAFACYSYAPCLQERLRRAAARENRAVDRRKVGARGRLSREAHKRHLSVSRSDSIRQRIAC